MNDRIKILIAVVVFAAVFLLVQWLKQKKKDRLPTITIRATIRSKELYTGRLVRSIYGAPKNARYFHVVFDLADGSSMILNTPEEFVKYADGTTGILVFQGETFERFDPDL